MFMYIFSITSVFHQWECSPGGWS